MTRKEAITAIELNPELGICYGRSKGCQLMIYREFLSWYDDTGITRVDWIEDSDQEDVYWLIERTTYGKELNRIEYESEEEVKDAYYEALERKYQDDNGAGGMWFPSVEESNIEDGDPYGFDEE